MDKIIRDSILKGIARVVRVGMVLIVCSAVAVGQDKMPTAEKKSMVYNGIRVTQDATRSPVLNKIISIHAKAVPLLEAVKEIAAKSKLELVYNSRLLEKKNRPVTIRFKQVTVEKALWSALKGTGLRFAVSADKQLVLLERKEANNPSQVRLAPVQETITGTVTDASTGETLPGVNILVKGTSTGASTDANGTFELTAESLQDTLVISFVGYQTQEVPINGRTEINIAMQSQAISGEEMVVVGYGIQQEENLTGSVSSVDMEQVNKTGATQTSQALAGSVSGLTVTQPSGNPGSNQAELRVRGLGTFSNAGNSPLVIVDGFPSSLDNVNSNDIENISVLKDAASAAIYGSRAANGVIIITTKEGRAGEVQVNYESYIGKREAAELPDVANSYISAKGWNTALTNAGNAPRYTEEEVQKFKSGNFPDEYPNFNHVENFFTSGSGLQTKHDLTVSGGTEETQYLFSAGYLKEASIVEKNELNRYNLRLNLNSKLHDNLAFNAKIYGRESQKNEPAVIFSQGSKAEGIEGVLESGLYFSSDIAGKKSDGTYGHFKRHPVAPAIFDSKSFAERKTQHIGGNLSLEWDVMSSLQLTGSVSHQIEDNKYKVFGSEIFVDSSLTFGPSNVSEESSQNTTTVLEGLIEYDKTFGGDHNIKVLGGVSQTTFGNEFLSGYRNQLPSNDISELNAASVSNDENSGNRFSWALLSSFGRVNYAFKEKYLFEANVRYDGSSRFSKGNRFGVFPSFSVGWNISEENFFQISWVENLKIRGSYGTLGNQEIGIYPYQKTLSLGYDYPIGVSESIGSGASLAVLPFENISWETTTITDIGMDIDFFNGKLQLTTDYYVKKTEDILYQLTVADALGMDVSEQNAGAVKNKGWEFDLIYRNTIGEFSYSITPQFSINQNEVTDLAQVNRDIEQGLFIGESIGAIYGYETEGLFVSEEDIENYTEQNYNARPGDVRYKDISGPNGVPDGKIDANYDRRVIGTTFPPYSFGLGLTTNYKGFDFYLQLQGQAGHNGYKPPSMTSIAGGDGFVDLNEWRNRWTPENPDRNASYPIFIQHNSENYWGDTSEYWMRDGSYLRIKNIQLGYTLPANIVNRVSVDQIRVYIAGRNIKTFDSYMEGYDPEMRNQGATAGGGTALYYPPARVWRIGLNINF